AGQVEVTSAQEEGPAPQRRSPPTMKLALKVVPKASRNRVVGWIGDRLKIAVSAAPERGKANDAVIETLAAQLGISPQRIRLVSGATSPLKTVEIEGGDALREK